MVDALIICSLLLGITSVIVLPLAVLVGLPLIAWISRSLQHLDPQEGVQLGGVIQVRMSRFDRIPPYIDVGDPRALRAWARTSREISALRLHSACSGSDPEPPGH